MIDSLLVRCFMRRIVFRFVAAAVPLLLSLPTLGQTANSPGTTEGDFVVRNFKFRSGESLAELRLHYTTLGKPVRDTQGRVTNAVLILHGTGGLLPPLLPTTIARALV